MKKGDITRNGSEAGTPDRLRALSETEIRYRGVMDTVPDMVFIVDESGVIVEANRAACERLGYSPEAIAGKRFKSFLDGGFEGSAKDRFGGYGSVDGIRGTMWSKEGAALTVEMTTTPRMNSHGEYCGSLTVAQVLEAGAGIGNATYDAARLLDAISAAMKIGVSIHSASYEITYQNGYLSRSYPDALGKKCYRVYRGMESPCRNCLVREAMALGSELREVVTGVSPVGTTIFFEMVGVPVFDDTGRTVGGFEIVRDVTELKEQLDGMAHSGGGEADVRSLQGAVSQPLSGISGYSELLKNTVGSENPAYRYATKIYEQSQRLATLVRKINSAQTIQRKEGGESGGTD